MMATGATALGYAAPRSEAGAATSVTAEIPAVPVGPNYGVLMPDGSIWYPGSRKRLPGPLPLRILVWALAFLVLLAGAADFIIHSHPGWVDPLRRHVAATGGTPSIANSQTGSTSSSHSTTSSPPSPHHVRLVEMSPQPSGLPSATTAYAIRGTSRYVVVVRASELTYMDAYDLVNGQDFGAPLYSGYVQPGATETISASGPVDVQVDAGGTTVQVTAGGKQVGTVAAPPYVPWHFWFEPGAKS
jgi:hypothetical protein